MARKLRVHYPGALYRVTVRDNNGEKVFNTEFQKCWPAKELNISLSMISKMKSGVSKGTGYVQEIIRMF